MEHPDGLSEPDPKARICQNLASLIGRGERAKPL